MNMNKVFKKSSGVTSREIGGDVVLLPLYKSAGDFNSIYSLNNTGAAAWKLIDGRRTLGQIKKLLMDKYDVKEERLEKQLGEFIKDLRLIKAVEE